LTANLAVTFTSFSIAKITAFIAAAYLNVIEFRLYLLWEMFLPWGLGMTAANPNKWKGKK